MVTSLGTVGEGVGLGLGVWALSHFCVLFAISHPYFVSFGSVLGTRVSALGFCPFFVSFVPKCPFPIFRCPFYRIDVSLPFSFSVPSPFADVPSQFSGVLFIELTCPFHSPSASLPHLQTSLPNFQVSFL